MVGASWTACARPRGPVPAAVSISHPSASSRAYARVKEAKSALPKDGDTSFVGGREVGNAVCPGPSLRLAAARRLTGNGRLDREMRNDDSVKCGYEESLCNVHMPGQSQDNQRRTSIDLPGNHGAASKESLPRNPLGSNTVVYNER